MPLYYFFFFKFVVQKACIACSRTSYNIVSLTNLNKYLHSDTSETEVNINVSAISGSERAYKNTANSGQLIIAIYALAVYVYTSCTYLSSWLESNCLFVGLGGWGLRGSEQNIWL